MSILDSILGAHFLLALLVVIEALWMRRVDVVARRQVDYVSSVVQHAIIACFQHHKGQEEVLEQDFLLIRVELFEMRIAGKNPVGY